MKRINIWGIFAAAVSFTAVLFAGGMESRVLAVEGTTPLYSFYNALEHDHFLTSSGDEKDQLCRSYDPAHPYNFEGEVWRVETRQNGDTVPVYRFYNDVTKDHFYTISEAEKTALAEALSAGTDHYVYEGIGWYAHSSGGTAVYRLFNPLTYDHYYTISTSQRDNMISMQGYMDEGIAWYEQQTTLEYDYAPGNYSIGISSGNTFQNMSGSNTNSYSSRARSGEEIVNLLNAYLDQFDSHFYYSPDGGPVQDWGIFMSVSAYGNHVEYLYPYYQNENAREPESNEIWCYIIASAGDGVQFIGDVYVDIYTGYVDAAGTNSDELPASFYLW